MEKKIFVNESRLRGVIRGLKIVLENRYLSKYTEGRIHTEVKILESIIDQGEGLGVVFDRMLEKMEEK